MLVAVSGCKSAPTKAPNAQLDNIAAIESELAANQTRLQSQGIVISPPASAPTEGQIVDDDEGGDEAATEPAVIPQAEPEPEPTAPPEPGDAPQMEEERDYADASVDSVATRREARVRGARKKRSRRSADRDDRTRCERICDLSDNTCELADKICALADEHVDDVRYEDACDRAEAQCEAATDACTNCED